MAKHRAPLPVVLCHPVWPLARGLGEARATYLFLKRSFDFLMAGLALFFLAPLFAVVALLIKLEDRGPVFFAQTRVGKGGRHFRFWKFRSMCVDAEAKRAALRAQLAEMGEDSVRFKMIGDPRITRVGNFLRRFSLDELPQFFNVFKGDMSLVGPRPPLPEEVKDYGPRELRRLEVEQGLTCIWQVSGRSLIPFEGQVDLDIEYIETRSFLFDLKLLLKTVPAVLAGRGAY
jgi:lipopolysaccharide/colanic/teichoic acid biosynthesis glycosyltransferase